MCLGVAPPYCTGERFGLWLNVPGRPELFYESGFGVKIWIFGWVSSNRGYPLCIQRKKHGNRTRKNGQKEKKKDSRNDQEQKGENVAAARLAGAMGDLNGNMSRGRRTGRLLTLYRSKGLFGALFERGSRGIHNLSHPFLYQVIVCQYLKECILSGRHAKQNTMKKGGSQN